MTIRIPGLFWTDQMTWTTSDSVFLLVLNLLLLEYSNIEILTMLFTLKTSSDRRFFSAIFLHCAIRACCSRGVRTFSLTVVSDIFESSQLCFLNLRLCKHDDDKHLWYQMYLSLWLFPLTNFFFFALFIASFLV